MTEAAPAVADLRSASRPWLLVACALVWIPVVGVLIARLAWIQPWPRIPSHWTSGSIADGFSDSTPTWVACLLLTIGAGIAGTLLLVLGADVHAGRRAFVYGIFGVAGAAAAIAWPVFQLTETIYKRTGSSAIGPPFTWWLLSIGWGLVVFIAARPWRRNVIDGGKP